jgi:L-ascorbate metabolism protein UlaG (beta-lactamase superfamily)
LEVAVVDPKGAKAAMDSAGVNTDNIIGVEMGDLSEKDREEVECEL